MARSIANYFDRIKFFSRSLWSENFYFIRPASIIIPTAILALFTHAEYKKYVCEHIPTDLSAWITGHEPQFLLTSAFVAFLGAINWPIRINREIKALEALLKALDIPACYRAKIFCSCLHKVKKNDGDKFSPNDFLNLVNPEEHINKYLLGILSFRECPARILLNI